MRRDIIGTVGLMGIEEANEHGMYDYERPLHVYAYMTDYTTPITTKAYRLCSFDDLPTRDELGDMYSNGWTVWVDQKWRTRMVDDPLYSILIKRGELPEPHHRLL